MSQGFCRFCYIPISSSPLCAKCKRPFIVGTNYAIESLIKGNSTSQTVVFKAQQIHVERDCILKLIRHAPSDKSLRELTKEIDILKNQRQFPFITTLYEIFEDEDSEGTWLALEYIEGKTLDHIVNSGRLYSIDQTLHFLVEMLVYLVKMHEHSIIHRDIKPSNIILDKSGKYVLLDFGIAKNTKITHANGRLSFTPMFSAPEQRSGNKTDARSDLFSLGATAYYLLTGNDPSDQFIIDSNIFKGKELGNVLYHALSSVLKKDIDDRPQSARIVLAKIEKDINSSSSQKIDNTRNILYVGLIIFIILLLLMKFISLDSSFNSTIPSAVPTLLADKVATPRIEELPTIQIIDLTSMPPIAQTDRDDNSASFTVVPDITQTELVLTQELTMVIPTVSLEAITPANPTSSSTNPVNKAVMPTCSTASTEVQVEATCVSTNKSPESSVGPPSSIATQTLPPSLTEELTKTVITPDVPTITIEVVTPNNPSVIPYP